MEPLKGITVVSIEQAIAAPFASRHLSDLGARVIKIERPEGDFARNYDTTVDGYSSHFVWVNRNKESVVLNLKDEQDKAALNAILLDADVFLHNLAPGAVDRLGFGNEAVQEANPQLITCNISGYGTTGPYAKKKAYDLLVQCEAGAVSITGTEDTPSKAGLPIADIAAGMYAFSGILSALYERETTGKARTIEISMLEALGEWMGYPMYYDMYSDKQLQRTGASHAAIAPYGPHMCGDGSQVFLAIQNEREWKILTEEVLEHPELTNHPDFANNEARVVNRDELTSALETRFKALSADELIELLDNHKIANARLRSPKEFAEHPQLKARERWTTANFEHGSVPILKPVLVGNDDAFTDSTIPSLGEHTDSVKEEKKAR